MAARPVVLMIVGLVLLFVVAALLYYVLLCVVVEFVLLWEVEIPSVLEEWMERLR